MRFFFAPYDVQLSIATAMRFTFSYRKVHGPLVLNFMSCKSISCSVVLVTVRSVIIRSYGMPPPLVHHLCLALSCLAFSARHKWWTKGGGHAIWPDNDGPNCNENDTARNGFARIENRVYISPKFGPSLELMSFVTPAVPLLFSSATYSRFHSCNYAFQRPLPREKMVQKACMCML